MKNHLQRSFLGIAITVVLLLVARAANAGMPNDRTFPVVGYDKGLVLHIGPKTDAEQVVIRFRDQYRDKTGDELTWRVLYDANPHGTIAVCRFRKDGPVFNPHDPHDASIWDDCDPSQQNIALIAGAYLRIPMESGEPPSKGTGRADTSGPGPKPTPPPAAPASAGAPEDAPTSRPAAPPAESAIVPESPSSAAPEVPSASSAPSAAPSASEAPAPSASRTSSKIPQRALRARPGFPSTRAARPARRFARRARVPEHGIRPRGRSSCTSSSASSESA